MKKRLELNRETLHRLQEAETRQAQGGMLPGGGGAGQFSATPQNPCYTIYTCARGGCKTVA